MRVLLRLEYDGTDFRGWQLQPGQRTVQQALEGALTQLVGEHHRPLASSRTDAGVHARGLPVVTRFERAIPPVGVVRGLNTYLPGDVSVRAAAFIDEDFDVRRSAQGKRYCYRLWNGPAPSALQARWSWFLPKPLDLDAMRRAAAPLLGEHDYSAFQAAGCQAAHAVRRITAITIRGQAGGAVEIEVEGNAFLQHMVRIIAGSLVEVGRGHRSEGFLADALASRDRTQAGQTAPGNGLTLEQVVYDPDPFMGPNAWPRAVSPD